MDRNSVSDRLPFGRIPGLGSDTDETESEPDGDTVDAGSAVETDSPADDKPDSPADTETDSPVEIDLDEPEDTPSRRDKVRKVLLGVSLGGLGLALLAALLRRLLGGSDDEDDGDADFTDGADADSADDAESESLSEAFGTTESDTEPPADEEVDVASELLTADAEGVAALIGLGFQLLVRTLVGEDESESSTA